MKFKYQKQFRKVDIMVKILETLQIGAEFTVDLLDIFTSSYYDSYKKIKRSMMYGSPEFKTNWSEKYLESKKFYSLLNRLKNQGFIKKEKENKKTIWSITRKGLEKLKILKKKNKKILINYPKEKSDKLIIVIFDIPEKERHKRNWLRSVLALLDFKFLQQSVWIGKTKIPEEFLNDLRNKKMLDYVHIFKVSKSGTINKI